MSTSPPRARFRPMLSTRRRDILVGIAAALAIALASTSAAALVFARVPDVDELSATVPLIVRGRVVAMDYDVVRTDSAHAQAVTAVHIQTLSALKGAQSGGEITVRQLGGPLTADGRRWLHIPGVPRYSVGEEVLVFVDDRMHPFIGTAYGDRGLFRIARAQDGRRLVLTAGWEVLANESSGPKVDGTSCRPLTNDRARCTLSGSGEHDEDVGGKVLPAPVALSVEAFESRIRAHVPAGSAAAGPAQTISASAAAFAEGVAAFLHGDTATIRRLTGTGVTP